jgi:hypothetical protein
MGAGRDILSVPLEPMRAVIVPGRQYPDTLSSNTWAVRWGWGERERKESTRQGERERDTRTQRTESTQIERDKE